MFRDFERLFDAAGDDLGKVLDRLVSSRESSGLSRGQVAQLLGVSTGLVQRWETGESDVSLRHAFMMASLYGVSIQWLMTGKTVSPEIKDLLESIAPTSKRVQRDLDKLEALLKTLDRH